MIAMAGVLVAVGVPAAMASPRADPVPPQVDFGVTLDGPSETSVGGRATYEMEVTNAGPDKEDVKLRFTRGHGASSFDEGAPVRTISQTANRGDCATDPLGVICRLGQLAPGDTAKAEVVLKVFAEDLPKLAMQATVAPELDNVVDGVPANNHAEVSAKVREPVSIDGLPENCATRPFKLSVAIDVPKARKTNVIIDGKVRAHSSHPKLTTTVKPADLDNGSHKLSVVVFGAGGPPSLASLSRKFKTC
jgi:hypothetical protein